MFRRYGAIIACHTWGVHIMQHLRKVMLVAVLTMLTLSAFSVSAAPAARAVTITEQQINSSFRVTNPVSRRVTDVRVDLQPGQAVISATITLRRPAGQATTSFQTVSTWTPVITNSRLSWTLTSATVNGSAASTDLINQINAAIGTPWRSYWRTRHPGRLTAITIDQQQIVLTFS
jgi:hypothetical protein